MIWQQREIQLPDRGRGLHPISREILEALPELAEIEVGLLHVFLLHTSASLTINENADPDVLVDIDDALDRLAPQSRAYRHQEEGPDDMPGHIKASLLGSSLSVPVRGGRLRLGTWQGICLCEHRQHGGRRRVVLTLMGQGRGE